MALSHPAGFLKARYAPSSFLKTLPSTIQRKTLHPQAGRWKGAGQRERKKWLRNFCNRRTMPDACRKETHGE